MPPQPCDVLILLQMSGSGEHELTSASFNETQAAEWIELSGSLWVQYEDTQDEDLLLVIIGLGRQVLSLLPDNHPNRAPACANLSAALLTRYEHTRESKLLLRAINLKREALSLIPDVHANRALICRTLASSLVEWHMHAEDDYLIEEAIDLYRESLDRYPDAHPDRAISCTKLASALWTKFKRNGDDDLLHEAIELERQALNLRPEGHPDRAMSCGNLALSLKTCYERTGDQKMLSEAIDLYHDALILRPAGHPNRATSCLNLASSLWTLYECTGDEALIDKGIDLEREVSALYPEGHIRHAAACANLALTLKTRYERTGDANLLEEAIDLERKALTLYADGDPHRAISYANLALSLQIQYECTGDDEVLDEAVHLNRQALALHPQGHPDRATSCANLASSLWRQYRRSNDVRLLDDAIDLEDETLALRPEGHMHRAISCYNLALSLQTRYELNGDEHLLKKAFRLQYESLKLWSTHEKWRSTVQLCGLYLQQTPVRDIAVAIDFLRQSFEHDPDDISTALKSVLSGLNILWDLNLEYQHHVSLVSTYNQVIDWLPLLINPVLNLTSQLSQVRNVRQVGSDAFVNAVLAHQWKAGIEHLDMAQGAIWAQRLHQRDPQLGDVPPSLAAELERSLQALKRPDAASSSVKEHDFLTSKDIQHKHSLRMYSILREIRAVPGLQRFMLGETLESLLTVSSDHPVVVLAGSRGRFYAIVMAHGRIQGEGPLELQLKRDDLPISRAGATPAHRGGCALTFDDTDDTQNTATARGMRRPSLFDRYLETLWNHIVKPVLDLLQLQVRIHMQHITDVD